MNNEYCECKNGHPENNGYTWARYTQNEGFVWVKNPGSDMDNEKSIVRQMLGCSRSVLVYAWEVAVMLVVSAYRITTIDKQLFTIATVHTLTPPDPAGSLYHSLPYCMQCLLEWLFTLIHRPVLRSPRPWGVIGKTRREICRQLGGTRVGLLPVVSTITL